MTVVNPETGEIIEPLDAAEECSLERYEEIISEGLKTFVDVGDALATIRNARLYRASHSTFESYCESRWSLSRKRAYDLMGAAETVAALSPMGDTPMPTSERQARELSPLRNHPAAARKVWAEVQDESEGKPTAAIVRSAVKRHLASVPTPPPQDEEFWNDAAQKATASGWVAQRDAERPFSMALTRLTRISGDINAIDIDPIELADKFPSQHADALPQIEAAYQWLHSFVTAQKDF